MAECYCSTSYVVCVQTPCEVLLHRGFLIYLLFTQKPPALIYRNTELIFCGKSEVMGFKILPLLPPCFGEIACINSLLPVILSLKIDV